MDRNQSLTPYIGVWKSREYHVKTPDGWQFYEYCGPDEVLIWEIMANGNVIERMESNPAYIAVGTFCTSAFELCIQNERNPCWKGRLNQRYRVELISDNELWLYGLEDVINEPEEYHYRLKAARKTTPFLNYQNELPRRKQRGI